MLCVRNPMLVCCLGRELRLPTPARARPELEAAIALAPAQPPQRRGIPWASPVGRYGPPHRPRNLYQGWGLPGTLTRSV